MLKEKNKRNKENINNKQRKLHHSKKIRGRLRKAE